MEHLISAITLAKNYGIPDIDNTQFSNFNNWNTPVPAGTNIIFQNSGIIQIDTSLSQNLLIDSGSFSIDPALGNNVTLNFTLDRSSTVNGVFFVLALDSLGNGLFNIASGQLILAGSPTTQSYSFSFNTSGQSIVKVRFGFSNASSAYAAINVRLANITVGGTAWSNFNTGDRIISYWDDVAETIKVYSEDNPGATTTLITDGPDLGQLSDSQFSNFHYVDELVNGRPNTAIKISNYAFCEGNDKTEFRSTINNPSFPYWEIAVQQNSPYCVINPDPDDPPVVCDIQFTQPYQVLVYPSNAYSADGSFQVFAESGHADISNPVKYTDTIVGNNGTYSYISNDTGIFTFRRVGTYNIYAVDKYNCRALIQVKLEVDPSVYGTIYRQEFKDIQNLVTSRMDIKQSQYTGPVNEEISDGDAPVTLNKVAGDINNKFQVIRGTNAQISLISTSDLRYIGMFSQNDRKFMPVFQKPVGTEVWRGFVTPSIYSEPYISKPYAVNLNAVDGLDTLSNYPFQDDSGNNFTGRMSLISIIMICLNKLNLNLGVRSSVNKYATGFNTGVNDDPLDQTYFNVDSFYDEDGEPLNCDEVLEAVLKPFGAEVLQCLGWFNIVEVDNKTQAYNYRTFTKDGVKIVGGNGTFDPIVSIVSPNAGNGILFADQDANLEILPAYGIINIEHKLIPISSMFDLSMEFWQANFFNAAGAYPELYTVKDKKIKGIKINNLDQFSTSAPESPTPSGQGFVPISSKIFTITSGETDFIDLKFEYKIQISLPVDSYRYYGVPNWVRVEWQLRYVIGSSTFYYSQTFGWVTTNTFNPIYVNDFNVDDFKSFSKNIALPELSDPTEITLQLVIQTNGAFVRDFINMTTFRALNTTNLPSGYRIKGLITGLANSLTYYTLVNSTDADNYPFTIRPDDYDTSTNTVVWKADIFSSDGISTVFYGASIPVKSVYVQNIDVDYLPNNKKPVEIETISLVNDNNLKENLTYPIVSGDLPSGLSKELYTNWFSDADGNPTSGWARSGFSESTTIQQILMKGLSNQYAIPTWKISGSFLDLVQTNFLSVIKSTTVPADVAVLDSEFDDTDTPSQKWNNYGIGSDWVGNSTHKPQVDFVSVSQDSKYYIQNNPVEIKSGTRINVDIYLVRINTDTDFPRLDRLVIVLLNSGVVVQKVTAVDGISYDAEFTKSIKFNTIADSDNIGFYIENIDGISGTASYYLDYFRLKGLTIIRYFGSNSLSINDRHNNLSAELFQLIPAKSSVDPDIDDTGGGSTDPGDGSPGNGGGSFNGAFSDGWSGEFDTILN